METKYWTKIKEFHGVQVLRDPETMQCRILPIERPQQEPQTPAPVITPEMNRRAEAALNLHKMIQAAGERTTTTPVIPVKQPESPLTPEEEWRHDPALRAEFNNNINAYLAYCKAVESGRCRIYGR